MGKTVMFMLDARLDLTAEERARVSKYKLGDMIVYNSASSRKHMEGAARTTADEGFGSFLSGMAHAAMSRLSLNISIDGLTKGQHIECKDMDELLGAENAIRQAAQATQGYLSIAETFDGREVVIDISEEAALAA